jgi:adenine-specific DNA-methyltransferase
MENNQTNEKLLAEIDRLKKELKKKKKYGLVWEDKPEDVVEMCKEKLPVLKEVKSKEIITDKNKPVNLLIEGDNYHALSVLNYTHKGKIDVIYIDPPYNTGKAKEWKYNDKYVDENDGYKHSKWLNMMEKRLTLAKNLLKEAGVIFVSIDVNEVAQIKLLSDYIFKENKLGLVSVVNNLKGRSDDKFFATANEFLLVYAKNSKQAKIQGFDLEDNELDKYTEFDDVSNFKTIDLRKTGKGWQREHRPFMFYPILVKNGLISLPEKTEIDKLYSKENKKFNDNFLKELKSKYEKEGFTFVLPKDTSDVFGRWRWGIKTCLENIKLDNLVSKKTSDWKIFEKMRPQLGDITRTTTPKTIFYKSEYDTGSAGKYLKSLFGKEVFENPKSLYFIKDLLRISTGINSVILDFFAGSGTTGEAVLDLNSEDNGNRKFIISTNNEGKIAEEVCYPRIEKIIRGYKNTKKENIAGLGGNLKYFKTDFVDYKESTDRNKIKLTKEAVEMLCVKEGTFELVTENEEFKIFKNQDHYAGIIFDQLAIKDFKKAIKNIKGKISVYIFSLGDDSFEDEFEDIKQKVKLSPIPEAILKVYRRIYK